jgi:hypothetical protein
VPDQGIQIAIEVVVVFEAAIEFENDRLARIGEQAFGCARERDGNVGLFVINKPSVGAFNVFPHLSRCVANQENVYEQNMFGGIKLAWVLDKRELGDSDHE